MSEELLIHCGQCQRRTRARRKQRADLTHQVLAFLLFLGGTLLLLSSPTNPPLAVPAVLLIAIASWLWFRRVEVWQCGECGASLPDSEPLQYMQSSTLHQG